MQSAKRSNEVASRALQALREKMSENIFKQPITEEFFRQCIVGQDDDEDYDESGWVAVVHENDAALANYGHCSCFGTLTAICGGDYSQGPSLIASWNWMGTKDELIEMAFRVADPDIPERKANPTDIDYNHLTETYQQIRSTFCEFQWLKEKCGFTEDTPLEILADHLMETDSEFYRDVKQVIDGMSGLTDVT